MVEISIVLLFLLQFIVPGAAVMREEGVDATKSPVDTLYWMREAELKHGRVAQLAGDRPFVCRRSTYGALLLDHPLYSTHGFN